MRQLILFILLCIGFQSHAERPFYELVLDYRVDSVRVNPDLASGKSQVIVHIDNPNFSAEEKILYGYDSLALEALLNEDISFQFVLDPGEHVFQFYPPEKIGYNEITTYPIHIETGTITYMTVNFTMTIEEVPLSLKKPVIYLYPTQKTNVTLSVHPKGELSFTYPEYKEKWEFTAFPSGEIKINDNSYNYLFWESEQLVNVNEVNQTEGVVVAKEDLMEFLESALNEFGFNSKEKMDFITYWAPQMLKHEATEVRFMFNDECTLFADLDIEPRPNNLLRFYMIWNPTDAFHLDGKRTLEIPTQSRTGFTVLEWGGMEIPRVNPLKGLKNTSSSK